MALAEVFGTPIHVLISIEFRYGTPRFCGVLFFSLFCLKNTKKNVDIPQLMIELQNILNKAKSFKTLDREELLFLLSLGESSNEAALLRNCANEITRKRTSNKPLVLAQIGIENHACPANCKFCSFAQDINSASEVLSLEEISQKALEMSDSGKLDALFIMAMHDYDADYLLKVCSHLRQIISDKVKLVVNIGDTSKDFFKELKKVGVSGAYHVCRLREGEDTCLNPGDRIATIEALKSLGFDWYNCCEPLGAEHTNEEILDQIEIGNTYECFQHAAMPRVVFENSPLARRPEISKLRLAQIVAVVTLASLKNKALKSIAVHEPNVLSLNSGANSLYAESGKNPRDTAKDTSLSRGKSIGEILEMFREANYDI